MHMQEDHKFKASLNYVIRLFQYPLPSTKKEKIEENVALI